MAGGTRGTCWETISRRRTFELGTLESGKLKRCLNRWDLTGLGVGSTLGVGTYVLLGYVALNLAGPSVILSFLIAAVAALLAGLCYAEFASRIPRAGTSYIYTYFTIGELAAFFVGWCNILEGLFSTASIAKGLSLYVDAMTNQSLSEWFTSVTPITAAVFSPYFDMLSFIAVLVIGALLAFGARESSKVNSLLTAVNVVIICFVVFAGAFKANSDNWYISSDLVPPNFGSGGFFPYGMWGTLRGAAVCFHGFVGFETISSAAEETRDPRVNIPLAILLTLVSVFFAYISVAIVVTMMVPYYLQDSVTSVAGAFSLVGWEWAWWVVSVGTVAGITASLYGAMFPLPRLLYAMSSDGLSVSGFNHVATKSQSPIVATVVAACIIAVLAGILELEQLLMMLCVGTLLSFTVVATCVVLLRYRSDTSPGPANIFTVTFGCTTKFASTSTTRVVYVTLGLFVCVCVATALVVFYASNALIPILVLHAIALLLLIVMALQPKVKEELNSKTPLVPLVPCLSIYVNIHLLVLINVQTWIRVLIWLLIGIPVYIICVCCCKREKQSNLEQNIKEFANVEQNGKMDVQIVVQLATPPNTIKRISNTGGYFNQTEEMIELKPQAMFEVIKEEAIIQEDEIIVQQTSAENNEEKEAIIIDLLDKVLQAEEDRYVEIIPLKEVDDVENINEPVVHRKSLSELSDAGSDASLGNQALSKYDVIAQVHREDLPIVSEEEEERNEREAQTIDMEEHEDVTRFNDSETNSRTDESGYSDTIIDRTVLNDSSEDVKEESYYIPPPPPLDESYFAKSYLNPRMGQSGYSDTTMVRAKSNDDLKNIKEGSHFIPPPPPLDENYFANSYFKKSYTMPKPKNKSISEDEILPPRESIQSNSSQGDGNIVFGSDRQFDFMSKLSTALQVKLNTNTDSDDQEQRKRSLSTGNVVDNTEFSVASRPLIFAELKKEIISNPGVNLRSVPVEPPKVEVHSINDEDEEDSSMNRKDLKSKLESIFSTGGPTLIKPRLMKSNPPTPEDAYQTESSSESIPKLAKIDKNDTLSRQKAKFGAVLNSIRLSHNSDEQL